MKQILTNFVTKIVTFVKTHLLATILILISIGILFWLVKYESKPIKKILTNDNTKVETDLVFFKDSLIREYSKIESKKDSLQNVINVLQKENKSLSLQTDLLKFKQSKLKNNEKNIPYLSDKNITVDSALNTINRVVTKYPIKVRN